MALVCMFARCSERRVGYMLPRCLAFQRVVDDNLVRGGLS